MRSGDAYQDAEPESGGRRGRNEESDASSSKKSSMKMAVQDGETQGRGKNRVERGLHEGEYEKVHDRDSRYAERKEGSREKGHGSREQERSSSKRRWDEVDPSRKNEESGYGERSESRKSDHNVQSRDRVEARNEVVDGKSKYVDPSAEKNVKSGIREEKRVDAERTKSRARLDSVDEDSRQVDSGRESRQESSKDDKQRRDKEKDKLIDEGGNNIHKGSSRVHLEKVDKHKNQRESVQASRDDMDVRDRSAKNNEDGHSRMRDRSSRQTRPGRRSRSPDRRHHRDTDEHDHGYSESDNERGSTVRVKERDKDVYRDDRPSKGKDRSSRETRPGRKSRSPERRHHRETDELDRGYSESDNERGSTAKGKERDKDVSRDDRSSKGKEGGWRDRSKEREPSKDNWKRSHSSRQDRDYRDGDVDFEYDNERDLKRREQDWVKNEKLNGRPAYRKDNRTRADGMRSTSSFANANEHSDTIEIRPNNNLDFGREDLVQSFHGRKTDANLPQENPSGVDGAEWRYQADDRGKTKYDHGDDLQERYPDDGSPVEQSSRRNSLDGLSGKVRGQKPLPNSNGTGAGQVSVNGSQSSYGINNGSGSHIRSLQQGPKGGRHTRGGRGRPMGRDHQRIAIPLPMMGPPFAHLALPPGPMPPLGPNMPPSPGPPIGPNVFIPPFPGPVIWPGARAVDMNMLAVPPSFPPIPPGPVGPRFAPNMATVTNQEMFFNQSGSGRGISPGMPGPGFNSLGAAGRGMPHDKAPTGWVPSRNGGPAGKAPSRGEQNDYSQNFVDTGMRPQNFIRELELTSTVEDYPKLRELIQKKDEIVANSASAPMYYKCDLREHVLTPEFFGTKFDVILVDPPWEEYVHRAPGVADHMEYWTFEEILNLKIEAIADTPSFIFLWVGDGVGLEQGRQCLKKWGFRRCEDICWVKTNKSNAAPSLRHDSHTLFQHSKEHCLMGIKGTVRRSTDGHIIHANIDTDIIIAEEPPYGSTTKPEDIYRIIEHFSLGRRRLELFGEDHNIRPGWLTVGKDLSSSNFNTEAYCGNFADKDGKVWQGGGGRNPPPDAPHLVLTTPDIESLRPKSPPAKNQQQQQSTTSVSTTANSSKRPVANSPQNPTATSMLSVNQGVSSSIPPNLMPWSSSQIGNYTVLDPGNADSDDKFFDNYGFNPSRGQTGGDQHEFDVHRPVNLL